MGSDAVLIITRKKKFTKKEKQLINNELGGYFSEYYNEYEITGKYYGRYFSEMYARGCYTEIAKVVGHAASIIPNVTVEYTGDDFGLTCKRDILFTNGEFTERHKQLLKCYVDDWYSFDTEISNSSED